MINPKLARQSFSGGGSAIRNPQSQLPPPPPGREGWPWTEETPLVCGNDWPRVTIITPSFNQGRYLEETIRSVLLQGCPNLQYIIMDGGSTDESLDIIRKYEPWLSRWVSEKDRGQSDAINRGFENTHGEIMAYLNSDDILLKGALQSAVSELRRTGAGWCTSDVLVMDENSHVFHRYVAHRPRGWIDQISRVRITTPQPSTFWQRTLWEECGPFDAEMFYSFDFDLWCKFLLAGHFPALCAEPLSALRQHGQTKTALFRRKMHEEDAIIWQRCMRASGPWTRVRAVFTRTLARAGVFHAAHSLHNAVRRVGRKIIRG